MTGTENRRQIVHEYSKKGRLNPDFFIITVAQSSSLFVLASAL